MDDYGLDDQPQEEIQVQPPSVPTADAGQLPPEDLNPWISIIYRPRDTIRFVLDTGAWNNVWLLYAIVFIGMLPGVGLSFFMQSNATEMPDLPDGFSMNVIYGFMFVVYLIVGYPLSMLMLYITGWMYRVIGGWLDGVATTSEMTVAVTWTYVLSMYLSWPMLVPNGMLVFFYQSYEVIEPGVQFAVALAQIGVSLPVLIVYIVVASKSVAEAHRFSAWRGFATMLIFFLMMMALMVFLFFGLFVIIFVAAMLMQV